MIILMKNRNHHVRFLGHVRVRALQPFVELFCRPASRRAGSASNSKSNFWKLSHHLQNRFMCLAPCANFQFCFRSCQTAATFCERSGCGMEHLLLRDESFPISWEWTLLTGFESLHYHALLCCWTFAHRTFLFRFEKRPGQGVPKKGQLDTRWR